MHRIGLGTAGLALSLHAGGLGAQQPTPDSAATPDSAVLAAAAQAGAAAGARASVNGPRWGSAVATFFLTPFVGGVGALVAASVPPGGAPRPVPAPAEPGRAGTLPLASPAAAVRYHEAYRAVYVPRRRRAMQRAVLVTTGVFFLGMVAISG
jgi:hypothetical protein